MQKRGIRGIVLLCISLFIIPLASGLRLNSTGVYHTGENFSVEGVSYVIIFTDERGFEPTEALIESEEDSFIISEASCKSKGNVDFCLNSIYFTYPNATHNYTQEASLSIYRKNAELEMEKIIDKGSLLEGEETDVEVTIKNTGDWEATDIVFTDNYPYGIGMTTKVDGCFISGNSYRWEGSLDINQEHKCEYTIIGESPVENSTTAKLRYYDGSEIKNTTLVSSVLVFGSSLQEEYGLQKDSLWIGDGNLLYINLSNANTDHAINGKLVLSFPKGTEFVRRSSMFERQGLGLTYKYSFDAEESESLYVNFTSKNSGELAITSESYTRVNGFSENSIREVSFTVLAPKPAVRFDGKSSVMPGEIVEISAAILNPSEQAIKDLAVSTSSDIPGVNGMSRNYNEIGEEEEVFEELNFDAPSIPGVYNYSVTVIYHTKFNERLVGRYSHELRVIGEDEEAIIQDGNVEDGNKTIGDGFAVDEAGIGLELGVSDSNSEALAEMEKEEVLYSPKKISGILSVFSGERRLFASINIILMLVLAVMFFFVVKGRKKQEPKAL